MFLIVVFGRVATGKSTLTDRLQAALPAVVYRKDEIKEIAFDTLGAGDRQSSQAIGRLSIELCMRQTLSALGNGVPCVLEGNFRTQTIERLLEEVPATTTRVVVRCDAADEVVLSRFTARSESGTRHPGHGDEALANEYQLSLPAAPAWPAGEYERIDYEAGTNETADTVATIRSLIGGSSGR